MEDAALDRDVVGDRGARPKVVGRFLRGDLAVDVAPYEFALLLLNRADLPLHRAHDATERFDLDPGEASLKGIRQLVGSALLVTFTVIAYAASPQGEMRIVTESTIPWGPPPPVLAKGLQFAVISGDPSKPGPFVFRVKAPAGYVVAPHTHPTAENLTVISGTIYQGMGDKLDRAAGKKLNAGDFVHLPAGMAHSIWSDEPAEVQVSGTGPFEINYVNSADDPRNQAH